MAPPVKNILIILSDSESEPERDSDYKTAPEGTEADLTDEYPDSEVDELIRRFRDSDMFQPSSKVAGNAQKPPEDTKYLVRHRDGAVMTTPHWSQAATRALDQGAQVNAIKKRSKRRHSGISPEKPLVVFAGRYPGVYPTWKAAKSSVHEVSGSIYMRYSSPARAQNAFQYALHRGWVRKCRADNSWVAQKLESVQFAHDTTDVTPLNDRMELSTWYCVYRGLTPGIYRSLLEAQLNVLKVSGSAHEGFKTAALAREKYAGAELRGELRQLSL